MNSNIANSCLAVRTSHQEESLQLCYRPDCKNPVTRESCYVRRTTIWVIFFCDNEECKTYAKNELEGTFQCNSLKKNCLQCKQVHQFWPGELQLCLPCYELQKLLAKGC